jgi:hypothetical protein
LYPWSKKIIEIVLAMTMVAGHCGASEETHQTDGECGAPKKRIE